MKNASENACAEHIARCAAQSDAHGEDRRGSNGETRRNAPDATRCGTARKSAAQRNARRKGGGLRACARAEAIKHAHAAPLKIAIIMALPFSLLGAWTGYAGALSFSPWNYWYALLMPVSIVLVAACVGNADARLKNRVLLGSGAKLSCAWWAKALYCLALSLLSNLIVFAFYVLAAAFGSGGSDAGALPTAALSMATAAVVLTITSSWIIPAVLLLVSRVGLLAGIFIPLAIELAGGFAWGIVPIPQLFPPSATTVIPTSFIPVLPSGEPLSADIELGAALSANGALTLAGIAICAIAFVALSAYGSAWLSRSEELS